MTRGPAGRQGRPFPTFAMSYCNRAGSAVHCLAQSEVQVIKTLFVTCTLGLVLKCWFVSRRCASYLSVSALERLRVCMYILCMIITYSRVWINRVRLPILLVVS